ncbi:hypothetical protein Dsin_026750 [Dipteronia sinensis]|uniref:Endonuclease/exonuclease/phosphatase domain-containing protein n=1 Tax=Dipteronia sinensis TaxID=43782 RepID=A0AAD9ZY89_9ROSI|nr:hypothetical protein Dsin_026750 [Dipteronia sinensis]
MKILVWNTRGLGSTQAFHVLRSFQQADHPNIVFLMETKADKNLMESIHTRLGFNGKLVVECEGSCGGLCMYWTNLVDVNLFSFSRYHVDVKVLSHSGFTWRFTGFYGHPEVSQRHHAWTLLRRLHSRSDLPWLCAGDFNEILEDSEKQGGIRRPRI